MPYITYNDKPIPKWFKLTVYIIFVIVVVMITYIELNSRYIQVPRLTSAEFIRDIEAKKLDQAYHLTGSSIQKEGSETDFIKALAAEAPFVYGTAKEIDHGLTYSSDGGLHPVYFYSVKAKTTIYFRVEMKLEQGNWTVFHFQVTAQPPESTILQAS